MSVVDFGRERCHRELLSACDGDRRTHLAKTYRAPDV